MLPFQREPFMRFIMSEMLWVMQSDQHVDIGQADSHGSVLTECFDQF